MSLAASHSTPYMKWLYSDINVIRLFDFLRWDEKEIEGKISRELGGRKSGEIESSWRFDCRLDYVRRYMYAATVGVTELQDLYSKMIREGMITREEAFERLKKENWISRDIVSNVLEQLDLNLSELNLNFYTKFLK